MASQLARQALRRVAHGTAAAAAWSHTNRTFTAAAAASAVHAPAVFVDETTKVLLLPTASPEADDRTSLHCCQLRCVPCRRTEITTGDELHHALLPLFLWLQWQGLYAWQAHVLARWSAVLDVLRLKFCV